MKDVVAKKSAWDKPAWDRVDLSMEKCASNIDARLTLIEELVKELQKQADLQNPTFIDNDGEE